MEDIVIGIGGKVVECLAGPILDRARYLFCFNKFIGELKEAEHVLKRRLEEVKERIEQAARNSEEITLPVKNWLNDVEKILENVQELQQKVEEEGKSCFNVSLKYSLAKQMDNKAKRMMELRKESYFEKDHFSYLIQLPGITYFSSKGFVDFKSRESTYKRLLEAIKDGKNKMIGLCGMGGSGKTTLVKEVGKEVEKLKIFEKVIMVIVSKPLNVTKVQQDIAEQIDLKFSEETPLARAQRLSNRLKNKKILIILDDVWEYLKLEDIGIPLVEGCQILLTTRLRNVCGSMGCKTIELPLITREEAWELFKKHANLCNDSSNMFDDVGRKIVNECKELPIAIVVVGRSLKGKRIGAWESALKRLERSQPLNVAEGLTNVNACLELSYEGLSSSTAKSLFLLCSMFPEDHEIHREDLIRFGKRTLELEESIVTMEDARREILDALDILLDSFLLMSIEKEAYVKMHDLARDVALWIAKKQRQAILVDNQAISNMLIDNYQSLEDTKAVSLWNFNVGFKLSKQLHCPKLEILLLHPYGFIQDIGAIESLKVLALIAYGFNWQFWTWLCPNYRSILQSIVLLTNLQTLCLRQKSLGDISLLCELKRLEILDLRGSQFDELPAGIVYMKMLKLLDIFGCQIEKSPLEVIGRCEQLEELYFWDKESVIPEILSLSNLKRYVIYDSRLICQYWDDLFQEYLDSCEALRALCIQGFRVSALNPSMKDHILRANHLWLDNCRWGYKDINFQIKHLVVSCCQEKRFIIENHDMDILQTQVFPHLITLRLFEMNSLEQVFQDSSLRCSLPMLQELWIRNCLELRICIFSHATITSLPELRKLHIDGCNKVKWLFSCSLASYCPLLKEIIISNCSEFERLIDEEAAHGDPLLHDKQYYPTGKETDSAYVGITAKRFNQLQNQQSLILFLRLKSLKIESSGKKKGILEIQVRGRVEDVEESIKVREPLKLDSELNELKLYGLPELEYIWKGPTQTVSLHRLENVSLWNCPKLKSIFTLAIVASLPELRTLSVYFCEKWEGIFCEESLKNLSSSNICFPKLKKIDIGNCSKVRWLLSYSLPSHCPSLEYIYIEYCSEFEGLIGEEVAHGDPLLHDMQDHPQQPLIRNCSQLERLAEEASYGDRLPLLKLKYLRLLSLPKLREIFPHCPRLRNTFTVAVVTSLPELRYLEVKGCNEWEGIFCEESLKNLSTTSTVCFPKLEAIHISDCHKVRRVFSYSLASHCPSLKELKIWDCCELEAVVEAYESEVAAHHQRLFPKLNDLDLRKLPKLREIYEGYEFNLLSGTITIEDCPNISKISKIPLEDKPSSSALEIKLES